ncbi:protein kinase family protein [Rhodococcus jostii]|uniref:Putative peptidoglycan lipid II flippase n=1 Tax=Rhodococcus jostii TaxID=132919 RepID=A0A1H5AI54_RHOJO|nr:protein kinase family protein [Rhodococcus jostii]SED42053.1 putative peptidoglycan lipid II flippase [Rhodococcus jostii]
MTATPVSGVPPQSRPGLDQLAPGMVVAKRYRLLGRFAGPDWVQWWHAHDVDLCRDVSLSLVDSAHIRATDTGADPLSRFFRNTTGTSFSHEGRIAQVYDIGSVGDRIAVVSEWTPGWRVADLARTVPRPLDAARTVRYLAAAIADAHHHGARIALDHPNRVRISWEGIAVLAFPATLADGIREDDVAGLGALLYALLLGTWPLSSPGTTPVAGLPAAARRGDGSVVAPHRVRPAIPRALSEVAMNALARSPGADTAQAVVDSLDRILSDARARSSSAFAAAAARAHDEPDDPAARPKAPLPAVSGALALIVALGAGGWAIGTSFTASDAPPAAVADSTLSQFAPVQDPLQVPLTPSSAAAYSPLRFPDNGTTAFLAVDSNPTTSWATDRYPQQLSSAKTGVGLIVSFPGPVDLRTVWIDSPTPGTTVEIRTAPVAWANIDHTQVIGSATLGDGVTQIVARPPAPTDRVLVWISGLSAGDSGFQSRLSEIGFFGGTP